ncbi:MAG: pullulanase-type alpha-1,6-glucosidase [Trueperaceae bacterium]|nr:pullulanase-type alpha-1,6-glucosidase [Trueperaceae bacterium]
MDTDVTPAPATLDTSQAHWLRHDLIAWDLDPAELKNAEVVLFSSSDATLDGGLGALTAEDGVRLEPLDNQLPTDLGQQVPHLAHYQAFRLPNAERGQVSELLRQQLAVGLFRKGTLYAVTGLQLPGVLDDLYPYDGPLGITWADDVPTLRVWAPTARSVSLLLFDTASVDDTDSNDTEQAEPSERLPMTRDDDTGVWQRSGDADWRGRYYLYEVEVYAPSTQQVETNRVTDPYSLSLARNSTHSQIVDLDDPALKPDGWDTLEKPPLARPEDITIYELHVRDFSSNDDTVPEAQRGTYLAFALEDSQGVRHLARLAEAGLSHLHLLPTMDFTSVDENKQNWLRINEDLAAYPGDSPEPQRLIDEVRDQNGYNWGYDPYHYAVPEGSYATNPQGSARIVEYRNMVQRLSRLGLRLVTDVVYNHTFASGQDEESVLDKIVPGYYYRLNHDGFVETSSCCPNTATEHHMMERLMVDSLLVWAKHYKVDGFRFDLMGHHMVRNMEAVQRALGALTLEEDGVEGSSLYLYGEGWDFGEVAHGARGHNASQINISGRGIGTFNDRLRDAARGGGPFGGWLEQGFVTGLYTDANNMGDQGTPHEQHELLLAYTDRIRIGLAATLADYRFENQHGHVLRGADIRYGGAPAGYAKSPREVVNYVSKHDNETLFDAIQAKAPRALALTERVRMQNLALSLVLLAQGIPFLHAGSDLLRSKSLDRNSYNSGDWFNKLDFSYQHNNWAVGLPPAWSNEENWPLMQPLLATPGLTPQPSDILRAHDHFREMLSIRRSSPLFRLGSAAQIQRRLRFLNTGPAQLPGVIVMRLSDTGDGDVLDPNYQQIAVMINASPKTQVFNHEALIDVAFELHPVQQASSDPRLREVRVDATTGQLSVPGRTTAVFVAPRAS